MSNLKKYAVSVLIEEVRKGEKKEIDRKVVTIDAFNEDQAVNSAINRVRDGLVGDFYVSKIDCVEI